MVRREAALLYFPQRQPTEYCQGQIIFDEEHRSKGLYLIVQGRVKVALARENGTQTVIDILGENDLFGHSALLRKPEHKERATTLERTELVSYTRREVERLIKARPRLGIALIQELAERCLGYSERVQMMAYNNTPERLALTLIRLAERMGTRTGDGSMRIPPLTQQVLAEFIGTRREFVVAQMSRLRRLGLLRYSRKGIEIFSEALSEHLR